MLVSTAISVTMVLAAAALTAQAPMAWGSGIWAVRVYLNGNAVPKAFGLRTLCVKIAGLVHKHPCC